MKVVFGKTGSLYFGAFIRNLFWNRSAVGTILW